MDNIHEYKIKGKRRTICPKCGKLGYKRKYKKENPASIYIHKYKINFDGVITLCDVCTFKTHNELNGK